MATQYQYIGVDRKGKEIRGLIEAPNEGEVRVSLRAQGIRPKKIYVENTSILGGDIRAMGGGGKASIKTESLVVFTRQLQVLIGSGIPLVQSLETLEEQTPDRNLKEILKAVIDRVQKGSFFYDSLARFPRAFPKIYVSLIKAGETAGAMDSVLKRLSRYLEDNDRLKKMLRSAFMYPAIVTVIGAGVIGLLMTVVIPKFEEFLVSSGGKLPALTQIVIDISHFLINHILLIIGTIVVGGLLLKRYFKSNEGRAVMDRVLFRLPLFGNLARKGGVARFARTMSTLLQSGVNLIDAIDICRDTIDNAVLEESMAKIREDIERGATMGSVIRKIEVFPKMAAQMISIGESTGNLDKMLDKVADFYETEVETLVAGLMKLIEPIVLVVLGGVVAFIMIAMYLPIFQLAGGMTEGGGSQ